MIKYILMSVVAFSPLVFLYNYEIPKAYSNEETPLQIEYQEWTEGDVNIKLKTVQTQEGLYDARLEMSFPLEGKKTYPTVRGAY